MGLLAIVEAGFPAVDLTPLSMLASATTWAAVGAIATLLTAVVTLVLGLIYSGRQTTYARKSAENARVSADAAVRATKLAQRNLEIVAEQMAIVRDQTGVLERQVDLGLLSLGSQDRPAFDPGPLSFEPASGTYTMTLTNVGRGTGWITNAQIVGGPDGSSLREGMRAVVDKWHFSVPVMPSPQVIAVGKSAILKVSFVVAPPELCVVWVVVAVRDFTAAEAWTYFFAYRAYKGEKFTDPEGRRASAMFASRGGLISQDRTVTWPLAELESRAEQPGSPAL